MKKSLPPYAIESVDNALQLLLLLRTNGSLSVTAAAAYLGVAGSTAHRLLAMLKFRGFVVQDAHKRYMPGPAALRALGGPLAVALPVLARSHMEALSRDTGETVNLVTLQGREVRFIESVEGTQVLRVGKRLGVLLPAERTSGGKVLLAELAQDDVADLYPALTDQGAGVLVSLHRQLSLTRRRGYGTNHEETEPGVLAVAVPVRNDEASVVAALTVSVPTVRYRRNGLVDLLPALRSATEQIHRDLVRS